MKAFAPFAAVLVLAAAACGGGGVKSYTRDATQKCFVKNDVPVSSVGNDSDFVANSATGGAFHIRLPHNSVTLSFGLTATDADNIDQAYRRFRSKNVGINDVLRRQGNAIMLWHAHPSDADLATVTGCLSG